MQMQQVAKPALRARILDHVESQLLNQGYRGMRVDDLARDVGISKRTLYEQFRTKEDMAREALSRRFERLRERVDLLVQGSEDEAERLRDIVAEQCRVHDDTRSTLMQDIESTPALNELLVASRAHGHGAIETMLSEGIARGRFRSELDVRMARCTLLAAVQGLINSPTCCEGGVDQAIQVTFDVILDGLSARSAHMSRVG